MKGRDVGIGKSCGARRCCANARERWRAARLEQRGRQMRGWRGRRTSHGCELMKRNHLLSHAAHRFLKICNTEPYSPHRALAGFQPATADAAAALAQHVVQRRRQQQLQAAAAGWELCVRVIDPLSGKRRCMKPLLIPVFGVD